MTAPAPGPGAGAGPDGQRLARAALTYLAEPGDPALGALLEAYQPAEVLAATRRGLAVSRVSSSGTASSCGRPSPTGPGFRAALLKAGALGTRPGSRTGYSRTCPAPVELT